MINDSQIDDLFSDLNDEQNPIPMYDDAAHVNMQIRALEAQFNETPSERKIPTRGGFAFTRKIME